MDPQAQPEKFSLVIPVYKNEGSIPELLEELNRLSRRLGVRLEVVFVVDGSPDACHQILREKLASCQFDAQLLLHSRNFGSFAAIRTGLAAATGDYFGVMAADLQEPPDLVEGFYQVLRADDADIAVGRRVGRNDPVFSRMASSIFWGLYRRLVQPEMPEGGVDVFGCNRIVRDALVELRESNSSLVGLLFWIGFRRANVDYTRLPRKHGKSAWTFKKKVNYLLDSSYGFSDLPLRILSQAGALALALSIIGGAIVLIARLMGKIDVPGYTVIVLTVTFFGGLNALGLGIIGGYVWRTFENTKQRPHAVVRLRQNYPRKNQNDG